MTVKLRIYDAIATTGVVPNSTTLAGMLNTGVGDVEAALGRLQGRRLLVMEPGDPSRIRMAPPFSGIETPFRVRVKERSFFANCVWDALGVAAALHEDADIVASDAHTLEPMTLEVRDATAFARGNCAIHFAVPAAKWWNDVVYT